ncbi:hypothetical protein [Sulfurimonas sp. C5]|uniref:hypothetical protein n=1 Tax=Sulfurimonas sp. C5 TaxID=3036947 RepID=UPI00245621BE|nr:hypothetical protein [Sulfurimonas sp. C5]MDH4944286.1 hypothetical protein [Sulfurimonas sp. C5]
MQVKQYLFQSPYSSPVQFGRVDPSSKESSSQDNKQLLSSTNQTANKAQVFQSTQTQEVTPTVSGKIDVYA